MNTAGNTRPRPVAVCTKCKTYSDRIEAVNQGCHRGSGKDRCKGIFRSAIGADDWATCTVCNGTAFTAARERCGVCQGTGWRFVRK